jgi:hypothetical protein
MRWFWVLWLVFWIILALGAGGFWSYCSEHGVRGTVERIWCGDKGCK